MEMTLANLGKNLTLSNYKRIKPSRDSHDVPYSIISREHEQILAKNRYRKI
jgi:hypothetical protein